MAAVLLDDAEAHGQAQTGAPAHFLGGKEGLENVVQILRGDAATGVRHLHLEPVPVFREKGLDGQGAPVFHGLDGVDEQIEKDLLEALGIPVHQGQVPGQVFSKVNARESHLILHQLQGILNDIGQGDFLKFRLLRAGKIQEISDDIRGPAGLHQDVLDHLQGFVLAKVGELLLEGLAGEHDVVIAARGFRSSWAMPAVRVPMAAILPDCTTCS